MSMTARRQASFQISRIPDEILSHIFLDVKYSKNTSQNCGPKSWMVVCEVCACWRAVAMNTPRLWADIYLERVKLATVMLERSGDAPLHIFCDLDLDTDSELSPFWSLAEKVLSPTYEHRIETLQLSCTDLSTLEYLLEISVSNMSSPRFHTLTIEGPCNFDLNSLTSLPFWNCLPRLRTLDLEYTSALRQMSTLASLTHFTCVSSTPTRTTVSWLLATLSNMPQVQHVTVRFISNGPADVVPSSSPPIKLPFLQHLRLFFMTPSATRFFKYVDIPPTASIDISFFVDDMPALVSDVETVFSQFAASINGSSIAPSETFKFNLDTDYTPQLSIEFRSHICGRTLSFRSAISRHDLHSYLPPFDLLPLHAVHVLEVESDGSDLYLWTPLLPKLVNVKTFASSWDVGVLLNLYEDLHADNSLPLPNLEVISCGYTFAHVATLERILSERKQHGTPIRKVIFADYEEGEELGRLRELTTVEVA